MSKEESVSPHDKIATLYSIIAANFPETCIEEWGNNTRKQTITTGVELPKEREELQLIVPHEHRNDRLLTQWKLSSEASFYSIKHHPKIRSHMERFRIYMNLTRITEAASETLGWFYKLHHKFTSRDEAHAELTLRLDTDAQFDICAHNVKVTIDGKLHDTKAIAISAGKGEKRKLKKALYAMSHESSKTKKGWTQTGKWQFLPFKPDGEVNYRIIQTMIRLQNMYIANTFSIAVTGITNIDQEATIPDSENMTSFCMWLLSLKAKNGTSLIKTVESGQLNNNYFTTSSKNKQELITWIDKGTTFIREKFIYDEHSEIMGPSGFHRRFRDDPTPDSDIAALYLEQIIAESPLCNENPNTPSNMDSVKNAWKHHPRMVYNLTDDSTYTSTVTDSRQPASGNSLDDAINEMKARTDALEKLADERKDLYKNMDTTALNDLTTKTAELAKKNKELDDWRILYDEQIKNRFDEQKKYIDRKMESNKEDLLNEMRATAATTNESLQKLLELNGIQGEKYTTLLHDQGNHMQQQINKIQASCQQVSDTVAGLQKQMAAIQETQSQMEEIDLSSLQDNKRRKEYHAAKDHSKMALRPRGTLVSPAKEGGEHRGSD